LQVSILKLLARREAKWIIKKKKIYLGGKGDKK
jgi:hypothetical protein